MSDTGFTCALIGADTLLMECGDILLSEGHRIAAVVTSEPRVARWGEANSLSVVDAKGDYGSELARESFDYLFAITHLAIIPDAVLELPEKLAINFHDGPLPRYAGLNAPVWALINGEESYGVTWHVMASGVDTGDILKQAPVEISPSETALSLNTKCMAAATESFPELVGELTAGTVKRTPQDLSLRSYFGKYDRPPAACSIDWSASSEEIEAFVRALTFGPYPNPVGSPKTYRADRPTEPLLVAAVRRADDEAPSDGRPGTVLTISEQGVTVAAGEGAVMITEARTLVGEVLAPSELAGALGLSVGTALGSVDSPLGERLGKADASTCRNEGFWARRLAGAEGPEIPQLGSGNQGSERGRIAIDIPDGVDATESGATPALLAAFAAYLARTGRKERFDLAIPASTEELPEGWYAPAVPLEVELDPTWSAGQLAASLSEEMGRVAERGSFLRDLVLREPRLATRAGLASDRILPVGVSVDGSGTGPGSVISLVISDGGRKAELEYAGGRLSDHAARGVADAVSRCLADLVRDSDQRWCELELVAPAVRDRQLVEWNRTDTEYPTDACVHHLFEAQVDRTPDAVAVVFRDDSLTYRQLDERANALARHLQGRGIGPDTLVGVLVERSVDLLVATLGVMKAGGAYVPLDPDFPPDRIAYMVEDSGAALVVAHEELTADFETGSAEVVRIDADWPTIEAEGVERPDSGATASNLAYAIYTSGSTGKPKGVLVEHGNVGNFFVGMDAVVSHDPPGVWLAVTSLSFDISVLELFWTLARGFEVVVFKDPNRDAWSKAERDGQVEISPRPMQFGLFMWGNDDGPTESKYDLMLRAAKYFDQNGFDSAWTPERHFHAFGGPFPNPSVTGAALAVTTERLHIRSGSCVSPLHHPIRIAEEWAVVDNLSGGRVGLSFAAGWQPDDFVIRPESYPGNKQIMLDQIDVVRRLWRGEKVEFPNPSGKPVAVSTLPRPVQAELPFWITTAGNPDSYRRAGEMGANVLTHLLGQTLEEVSEKIAIYREARRSAGHDPEAGTVTLMLHTFVGDSDDEVREIVREPMKSYLGASMKLVLGYAWSFPAFRRPGGAEASVEDVDLSTLSDEEVDAILEFAFDRYFEASGLFGTVNTCARMVERVKAADVDEIACLLDFGVGVDLVLDSLPHLKKVRDLTNSVQDQSSTDSPTHTFAETVRRHAVTHLQCTPSMARMLVESPGTRAAVGEIDHIMIGGEAFPPSLAEELLALSDGGTVTNMYGPTETTIWSSTHRLTDVDGPISIGRPIANTAMYVLDPYGQPLPSGIPGDLFIGGDGVTRGYHERPDLTAERFRPDPFRGNGARMYWTGDLAMFGPDGRLDFLGRIDNQVKVRGYRIELGEIEAALERLDSVSVAAVVARELQGDKRLVAYLVPSRPPFDESRARAQLREALPEYMVPSHFVVLRELPLTPNGKIDRKALPEPAVGRGVAPTEFVAPENELEKTIAAAWCTTLGIERVGVEDNFFDVGGHSLLVVQLHRLLGEGLEQSVSLVDLYRFPTVRSLTKHLTEDGSDAVLEESVDRAKRRREVMAGRRRRRG